jgi:septal ring factor EnvC (AmiA/AmiB activator)
MRASRFACLLTLVISASLCVIAGCDSEKAKIDSELKNLATENDQYSSKLSDQESLLEATKQRLNVQNSQLEEYNASVLRYMGQHEMAVVVVGLGLAGAGTALDRHNEYSQQTEQFGGIVAAGAALWAAAHMDEVSDVFTTLNQADAHVKTMKADIAQTSSAIEQERMAVQQTQQAIRELAEKSASLQQRRDQM